jgi:hypothetical protein
MKRSGQVRTYWNYGELLVVRARASSVAPIWVGVTRLDITVLVMWYEGIESDLVK